MSLTCLLGQGLTGESAGRGHSAPLIFPSRPQGTTEGIGSSDHVVRVTCPPGPTPSEGNASEGHMASLTCLAGQLMEHSVTKGQPVDRDRPVEVSRIF
ncbi:hypothetical protein ACOMHN_001898 [Nucella lapillus]